MKEKWQVVWILTNDVITKVKKVKGRAFMSERPIFITEDSTVYYMWCDTEEEAVMCAIRRLELDIRCFSSKKEQYENRLKKLNKRSR